LILGRKVFMRNLIVLLIPLSVTLGCAGGFSVLGIPTVVSDTSYDLAPGITNSDEVRNAMREEYPPLLRDAGVRGTAVLLLSVDDIGQVQDASVEQGSGHRALDDLALELAKIIQFSPAQIRGYNVPVWVTVPVNLVPPPARPATRRVIRREGSSI
jgi:TonB family protein